MAELNLKQIIDRLNEEFSGDTRKLVFWYDDKGEFTEDMESVELENAKVYFLSKDNQFETKVFLERVDKTTNYLVYAPFPKPDVKDNHLEDTMLYSKRFYADRASLLSVDLGIEEKYKPIIEKYIKFFGNKDRTQRFYDLEIENFNEQNILVGLLSALCKTRTCSYEEVVRIVITESDLEDNKFLDEFVKYDLMVAFWKLAEQQFGYTDSNPTLEKLLVTMFVTYTDRYMPNGIPKTWKSFVSTKPGNIIAFMDNLMNNVLYKDKYDEISAHVAAGLNASSALSAFVPDDMVNCDTFKDIDQVVVNWIKERLVQEDTGAKVDGYTISELCDMRSKMHFGVAFAGQYEMLKAACFVIDKVLHQKNAPGLASDATEIDKFKKLIKDYTDNGYLIDQSYRKFYYYYDLLPSSDDFEQLKTLVENIYTNEFLADIMPRWNKGFHEEDSQIVIPRQRDFYNRYVRGKEKTIVIISDAMRYEVGKELAARLQDDPRCTISPSRGFETIMSTLPSYTRLGMAALLPHRTLEVDDEYAVLVDGEKCDNLASRQSILQTYDKDAVCYQFDDIKNCNSKKLKDELFKGKSVIYIYHNQIDARGDKANTEDEVFDACESAIQEIFDFITNKAANVNVYRFVITADHGFIYKREKLDESDKIGGVVAKDAFINRRFIVSHNPISDDGVENIGLGFILGNDDQKVVTYPTSSNVFKVPGGGQNFVHGGSSPQEMLVPVIDIKMERGKQETKNVSIALVSMVQKITNLITTMDFIQSDPVSDTIKQTTFKMVFKSEDDEKISNENTYVADSREPDSTKRIFRMRFNFKNQKYDVTKQYYLVVYDANTDIEIFRHSVIMDLAFADDFGF